MSRHEKAPRHDSYESYLARRRIEEAGFRVGNVDITIIAQAPKLAPYREAMREKIAEALCIPRTRVSVKATTEEGLGFTGRGEGIASEAAVLLEEIDD